LATMNGRMVKEFDLLEMYDSCANVYTVSVTTGNQRFGEGLGELYYFWGNVQTAHIRELYAYEKGPETWGTFLELSTLLTVESGFEGELSIFPNPAQDQIMVHFSPELRGKVSSLSLWSMNGKLLKTHSITGNEPNAEFNLTEFPAGMYLITLENNGSSMAHRRIAVQR
jgi:hypothetical protein